MASTLSAITGSAVIAATVNSGTGRLAASLKFKDETATTYTFGASAGQVNKVYSADVSVSSSGATSLDLTTLLDPLGNSLNFSNVRRIKIVLNSTTSGQNLTIGGGTNGLFAADPNVLKPGTTGQLAMFDVDFGAAGLVVDSTHKILTLAVAAGTSVSVSVTILGQ